MSSCCGAKSLTLMLGSIFSFVGLAALAVAVFRRKREFLVLFWFGCFIGMYGLRLLAQATIALSIAHSSWPDRANVFVSYLLLVPGTLFWVELTLGRFHRFLAWVSAIALVIGAIGLGYYAATGSSQSLRPRADQYGSVFGLYIAEQRQLDLSSPDLHQLHRDAVLLDLHN